MGGLGLVLVRNQGEWVVGHRKTGLNRSQVIENSGGMGRGSHAECEISQKPVDKSLIYVATSSDIGGSGSQVDAAM